MCLWIILIYQRNIDLYLCGEILFSIPCVGFIALLIFAFGGTKNVNLKNFARSYFCFTIILVVLVVLFTIAFGGAAAAYSNL